MFLGNSFYKKTIIIIFLFCFTSLSAGPTRFPEKFNPIDEFGLNAEYVSSLKTRAADSLNCTLVGGWFRGASYAVSIVDTIAYLGGTNYMKILNVKDSTNPILLGEIRFPSGLVYDIFIKDTLAYVADIWEGFRIIDVSDPSLPTEIGFCETPGDPVSLWVQDTLAYIADDDPLEYENRGLRIIDISDPSSPIIVGSYNEPWGCACNDVWVQDTIAYVAGHGLRIIDVSDPSLPDSISICNDTLYFSEVYLRDTLVYAAGIYYTGSSNYVVFISIINVATPSLPIEIGFYNLLYFDVNNVFYEARDIWAQDSLAYIAVGSMSYDPDSCGLYIINVADPASINEVGNYLTGGGRANDLCIKDNLAYIGCFASWYDDPEGLIIIDVSNPSSPSEVGEYDTGSRFWGVWAKDSFAYVANSGRGLNILNVSCPSSPFEVGFCDTRSARGPRSVYVQDTFAYMADGDSGLCIINIASPSSPKEVGIYYMPGWVNDVYTHDTFAYVADSDSGLRIINVANPSVPTEIGFYETHSWTEDIWVQDTLAYLSSDSLYIINVSDPSLPIEVGSIPGEFSDLFIKDTLVYAVGGNLHIIDISDPSLPFEVGFYNTPGEYNEGIWFQDNLAYVANGDSGLRIIDVSNPSSPSEVGFYNLYWDLYAHDVYVKDSLIYVAYDRVGLYIFKYTGELPKPFITVTTPNEGEVWEVGSNHNITWISNGTSGNVRIEYSANNGSSWTEEVTSTTDDGSYSWTIPDNPSDSCLVRVSDTDGTPADTSDAVFAIISASSYITVTSPNGSEVWQVDSTYDVTWTSNGTSGNVQIEYSTDNGSSWSEIIASMPDTGSYPWVIPDNPSDSCLVRVSDTIGTPFDISDAIFTISSGSGVEENQILREGVSILNLGSGINIRYSLSSNKKIKIEIFNVFGQKVGCPVDEVKSKGNYSINWSGKTGIYFVRMGMGEKIYRQKVLLLK